MIHCKKYQPEVQIFLASLAALFLPEMLQLLTMSRLVLVRAMKQVQESSSVLEGLMQLSTSLNRALPASSHALISAISSVLISNEQLDSMFFMQLFRVVNCSELKE